MVAAVVFAMQGDSRPLHAQTAPVEIRITDSATGLASIVVTPATPGVLRLSANNASDVLGMYLEIFYDSSHVEVTKVTGIMRECGTGAHTGFSALGNDIPENGQIKIAAAGTEPLVIECVDIVDITVTAKPNRAGSAEIRIGGDTEILGPTVGETLDYEAEPAAITTNPSIVCGDMDGDGRLTVIDVVAMLQTSVGLIQPDAFQTVTGDLDRESGIGVADALIGLQRIVGVSTGPLSCGPIQP